MLLKIRKPRKRHDLNEVLEALSGSLLKEKKYVSKLQEERYSIPLPATEKMKIYRILTLLLSLSFASTAFAKPPLLKDAFDADTEVPERRAMRGVWRIGGGVATVTQDDELYKKYKDHGPIVFYDLPTTNATFRYAVKPEGCKSVVFTINGDGHVFRFVTGERGTNVRAFPPTGDHKSISTAQQPEWLLPEGEWTEVEVKVNGENVIVKFGDHVPLTVEHATYSNRKTNFSIGHSFGTLSIKNVVVE